MNRPRQLLAYGTVSAFLVFISVFGFADTLSKLYPKGPNNLFGPSGPLNVEDIVNTTPLDFSKYKILSTLSSTQFPIDDPTKRVIIVGDVHGMIEPFQNLLKLVKYTPSQDVLFHVGDIITKGPHKGSLAVMEYMSSNNITGVRGNHDQLVIEWRSWRNCISLSSQGKEWLNALERKWEDVQAHDATISLHSWLKDQKQVQAVSEKTWWKSVPSGGVLLDDHYRIAKDMSESQYQYLLNLPLRIYIPGAHMFIVHAGLLPSDPRYPVNDAERQPLARIPTLTRHQSTQMTGSADEDLREDGSEDSFSLSEHAINALRNLQEIAILAQIPQNNDPWVTLNMRSVSKDGSISKMGSGGTSWSKVWQQHMQNCNGYLNNVANREPADQNDAEQNYTSKKLDLKCYPSTTIYGHAAGRGLDIKRWSFGLDSGCVYGKRLSALIIQGQSKDKTTRALDLDRRNEETVEDSQEDDTASGSSSKGKEHSWLLIGDSHRAKVLSAKCHF